MSSPLPPPRVPSSHVFTPCTPSPRKTIQRISQLQFFLRWRGFSPAVALITASVVECGLIQHSPRAAAGACVCVCVCMCVCFQNRVCAPSVCLRNFCRSKDRVNAIKTQCHLTQQPNVITRIFAFVEFVWRISRVRECIVKQTSCEVRIFVCLRSVAQSGGSAKVSSVFFVCFVGLNRSVCQPQICTAVSNLTWQSRSPIYVCLPLLLAHSLLNLEFRRNGLQGEKNRTLQAFEVLRFHTWIWTGFRNIQVSIMI